MKLDEAAFQRMYYAGTSTVDIAKSMDVDYKDLYWWMYTHHYAMICPALQKKAMDMHCAGATDVAIAIGIDRSVSAVAMWRNRNGLKKNRIGHSGGRPKAVKK